MKPNPKEADYAGVQAWPQPERFVVSYRPTGDEDDRAFGWDGEGWYWSWLGDDCETPDADMYGPYATSHDAYRGACEWILEQLHEVDPFC